MFEKYVRTYTHTPALCDSRLMYNTTKNYLDQNKREVLKHYYILCFDISLVL